VNAAAIIKKFVNEYPKKNIVCLPVYNPGEIICELDPTSEHPHYSRAIVAIKKSVPHYHNIAVETYKVLDGTLDLFVDGAHIQLNKGDSYVIRPKSVHYASARFAIVQVDSKPGWSPEDHILVHDYPPS
jgi:mannose-6-phosphate isomerase-like protein (cupin superfamily)